MQMQMVTLDKTLLPTMGKNHGLDIIGSTIGRYFEYKQAKEIIAHETKKLISQKELLLKRIEAELTLALDVNNKNYMLEKRRLKALYEEFKASRIERSKVIDAILEASSRGDGSTMGILVGLLRIIDETHTQTLDRVNPSIPLHQITQGA